MTEAHSTYLWEQAEIARSRSEAERTSIESLYVPDANRERYRNPPADTPYPLEYVYHVLGDVSGQVVLDLGCGKGGNSLLVALRGGRVIGVDVAEPALALARTRLAMNGIVSPVLLVASSAHAIALPDESVDVVLGIGILHHLDLSLVAGEVRRVLKPGGRAIFKEPVRESRALKFIRGLIPYREADVSPFERPLTEAELREFARELRVSRSRAFGLPFVNVMAVVPFLKQWLLAGYRIDKAILERMPFLARYASTRVVELLKPSAQRTSGPLRGGSVGLVA